MRTFKLTLFVFLVFFCPRAWAADSWLCTQEASQRRGDSILSCGIGVAGSENLARQAALDHAKTEFDRVCGLSADCQGHKVTVTPNRTTCEVRGDLVKCYRLLTFSIAKEKAAPDPGHFSPFSVDQIANYPRLKKGMTKAQVMALFGAPQTVYGDSFFYKGEMCDDHADRCQVLFDESKLWSISDFKPVYDGLALN